MSDISRWTNTAGGNTSSSPDGFPEGMAPSGVNDAAREVMASVRRWYEQQWTNFGYTPTFVSATSFTVANDRRAHYHLNRRFKAYDAVTLAGVISDTTFAGGNTTVTVVVDSGSLTGALSQVGLGSIANENWVPTARQADQESGSAVGLFVSSGRQQYHPSAAKAWVNFNGSGTVTARSSYNVTSITDNGTGDYTINLTTAFSDTNYCSVGTGRHNGGGSGVVCSEAGSSIGTYLGVKTTSSLRIRAITTADNLNDADSINVIFYGDQ